MGNEKFTHEDSLKVIESMIEASKEKMKDNGFIWLMWGWLVLIASMTQYISIQIDFKYGPYAWFLMPIGGLVSFIYFMKESKKETSKTHVDSFLGYLWTAFGIAITITLVFSAQVSYLTFLPFCMILYGIGTYVSGGALKFNALKYGGLICFLCSAIAFKVDYPNQLLLISVAVLASYIVPGYILKAQYKKANV